MTLAPLPLPLPFLAPFLSREREEPLEGLGTTFSTQHSKTCHQGKNLWKVWGLHSVHSTARHVTKGRTSGRSGDYIQYTAQQDMSPREEPLEGLGTTFSTQHSKTCHQGKNLWKVWGLHSVHSTARHVTKGRTSGRSGDYSTQHSKTCHRGKNLWKVWGLHSVHSTATHVIEGRTLEGLGTTFSTQHSNTCHRGKNPGRSGDYIQYTAQQHMSSREETSGRSGDYIQYTAQQHMSLREEPLEGLGTTFSTQHSKTCHRGKNLWKVWGLHSVHSTATHVIEGRTSGRSGDYIQYTAQQHMSSREEPLEGLGTTFSTQHSKTCHRGKKPWKVWGLHSVHSTATHVIEGRNLWKVWGLHSVHSTARHVTKGRTSGRSGDYIQYTAQQDMSPREEPLEGLGTTFSTQHSKTCHQGKNPGRSGDYIQYTAQQDMSPREEPLEGLGTTYTAQQDMSPREEPLEGLGTQYTAQTCHRGKNLWKVWGLHSVHSTARHVIEGRTSGRSGDYIQYTAQQDMSSREEPLEGLGTTFSTQHSNTCHRGKNLWKVWGLHSVHSTARHVTKGRTSGRSGDYIQYTAQQDMSPREEPLEGLGTTFSTQHSKTCHQGKNLWKVWGLHSVHSTATHVIEGRTSGRSGDYIQYTAQQHMSSREEPLEGLGTTFSTQHSKTCHRGKNLWKVWGLHSVHSTARHVTKGRTSGRSGDYIQYTAQQDMSPREEPLEGLGTTFSTQHSKTCHQGKNLWKVWGLHSVHSTATHVTKGRTSGRSGDYIQYTAQQDMSPREEPLEGLGTTFSTQHSKTCHQGKNLWKVWGLHSVHSTARHVTKGRTSGRSGDYIQYTAQQHMSPREEPLEGLGTTFSTQHSKTCHQGKNLWKVWGLHSVHSTARHVTKGRNPGRSGDYIQYTAQQDMSPREEPLEGLGTTFSTQHSKTCHQGKNLWKVWGLQYTAQQDMSPREEPLEGLGTTFSTQHSKTCHQGKNLWKVWGLQYTAQQDMSPREEPLEGLGTTFSTQHSKTCHQGKNLWKVWGLQYTAQQDMSPREEPLEGLGTTVHSTARHVIEGRNPGRSGDYIQYTAQQDMSPREEPLEGLGTTFSTQHSKTCHRGKKPWKVWGLHSVHSTARHVIEGRTSGRSGDYIQYTAQQDMSSREETLEGLGTTFST